MRLLRCKKPSYTGALVLGLNDALVEMLGALTGLTVALSHSLTIASVSLITGIAASFSMAASEFLAVSEDKDANPYVAGALTGVTYLVAVIFLVSPYMFFEPWVAWRTSCISAIILIGFFSAYASRDDSMSFFPRFVRMVAISFGVAVLSYGIGFLVSTYFPLV